MWLFGNGEGRFGASVSVQSVKQFQVCGRGCLLKGRGGKRYCLPQRARYWKNKGVVNMAVW